MKIYQCLNFNLTKKLVIAFVTFGVMFSYPLSLYPDFNFQRITEACPDSFERYNVPDLLSICLPEDWVYDESLTEKMWEGFKEVSEGYGVEEEYLENRPAFHATGPVNENGFQPNVNILYLPLPADDHGGYYTLDDLVEIIDEENINNPRPGYRLLDLEYEWIDNRRSRITYTEDDYGHIDEPVQYFQMITIKQNVFWIVTCSAARSVFQEHKDDLQEIIMSFELLY